MSTGFKVYSLRQFFENISHSSSGALAVVKLVVYFTLNKDNYPCFGLDGEVQQNVEHGRQTTGSAYLKLLYLYLSFSIIISFIEVLFCTEFLFNAY